MAKIGFRFKLTVVFILFALAILMPTVSLIYEVSIKRQTKELKDRILGIVNLSASSIDVNAISKIKPAMESEKTEEYKNTKKVLQDLRNASPLIDSVYIMVDSGKKDTLLFLVDSGDKRKVSAHCGEEYDISGIPEMREGFLRPAVDSELTQDKWGAFLSGYAPLRDSSGKTLAIIGIDVKAESIRTMQLYLAKRFGIVLIFGILLSLILGFILAKSLTGPLKILISGVRQVGKGDLDRKVFINTKDELEELSDAFNKMTDDLKISRRKLEKYYLATINSLAKIIEAKDPYTKGHSERVARYAVALARFMKFSENDIQLLEEAALLHDIGKIGVPKEYLPSPLLLLLMSGKW